MKNFTQNHPETVATILALAVLAIGYGIYLLSLNALQLEHLLHY